MIRRLSLVLVACVLFPGTAAVIPVSDEYPDKTIAALRTCDESQLRKLFSSRRAGPMPGWGAAARGYWRWYPDLEGFGQPADRLVAEQPCGRARSSTRAPTAATWSTESWGTDAPSPPWCATAAPISTEGERSSSTTPRRATRSRSSSATRSGACSRGSTWGWDGGTRSRRDGRGPTTSGSCSTSCTPDPEPLPLLPAAMTTELSRRRFLAQAARLGLSAVVLPAIPVAQRLVQASPAAAAAHVLPDATLQAFADTLIPGRVVRRTALGHPVDPRAIAGIDSRPGAVEADALALFRSPLFGYGAIEPAFIAELDRRALLHGGDFHGLGFDKRVAVCRDGFDFANPARIVSDKVRGRSRLRSSHSALPPSHLRRRRRPRPATR